MRLTWILLPVIVVGVLASGLLLTSSLTRAVQNPTLAIDMNTADNTYDDTSNTMTVAFDPNADFCLATDPANTSTHLHTAHIIVQNVEDLIGWQVQLGYTGDQFRPNTVNFMPFTDNNTGQNISFVNLPLDQTSFVHREIIGASSPFSSDPGTQFAGIGSSYIGAQNAAISPDTPAKAAPDDTSYTAPSGGVLASVTLQVVGDQSGQYLAIDNGARPPDNANGIPGGAVAIFDGTGSQEVQLPETSLSDPTHAEGGVCQAATATPTPPPVTDTPTPTPGPGDGGTPPPGDGGTPTPTPAPGARTPTRTPVASPAALPPTGSTGDGGWSDLAYVLLFAAVAVPTSGVAYWVIRMRRGPV